VRRTLFGKLFDFDQTRHRNAFHIWLPAWKQQGGLMSVPDNDKHKEYSRYAVTCLEMLTAAPDQESRDVQKKMAAEWIRLADSIIDLSKPIK
jgi:hypothetical protein